MLLTGEEIKKQVELKNILIDPWNPTHLNPNSHDLTLGDQLLTLREGSATFNPLLVDPLDPPKPAQYETVLPDNGMFHLTANKLYLATTVEAAGSDLYAPMINGKSSLGRLGIQVHMTAGFGDVGFKKQWTLEIVCQHNTILRPGMRIAQVYFLKVDGERTFYKGKYVNQKGVTAAK